MFLYFFYHLWIFKHGWLVHSSGLDDGALFPSFPLASSTWEARSKAACRWCFSSYATWRHAGATETPGGTLSVYGCTSLAETELSENYEPWIHDGLTMSHHVSSCFHSFEWSPGPLVTSWIGPECWWPPVLVPTQRGAHLFAPQRMSCVSFTQTSRVNYWSISSHVCDLKRLMPMSCHRIRSLTLNLDLQTV